MADLASRSFNIPELTTSQQTFLQYFSNHCPLQTDSWTEFHIPKKISSKVTYCLLGKPLTMALWMKIIGQEKSTGNIGKPTQNISTAIPTYQNAQAQNKPSLLQHLLQGSGQVTMAKEILSGFHQLRKRWQPSQRPSNWLENSRQSIHQTKHTNSQWHSSLRGSGEKTRHQLHNWQYPYPSQRCAKK